MQSILCVIRKDEWYGEGHREDSLGEEAEEEEGLLRVAGGLDTDSAGESHDLAGLFGKDGIGCLAANLRLRQLSID